MNNPSQTILLKILHASCLSVFNDWMIINIYRWQNLISWCTNFQNLWWIWISSSHLMENFLRNSCISHDWENWESKYQWDDDYSFFTITNDTFEGLRNITLDTLIIKSAKIEKVQSHAFYYLMELKSLDMSGTSGITIANFSPALIGLQNTKIEKLRLSFMHGNDMILSPVSLEDLFCEKLALPHLVDLLMDHTQLIAVHPNCFIELLNLKVLNLSFNLLTIEYFYFIIIPSLLPHKHLTELDMSYNNYRDFVGKRLDFGLPPTLTKLNMSSIWRSTDYSNITISFTPQEPNKLEYLTFRSNSISILHEVRLLGNTRNVSFDFSNNNIISFTGAFDRAITEDGLRVQSLLLSGNKLEWRIARWWQESCFEIFHSLNSIGFVIEQNQNAAAIHLRKSQWIDIFEFEYEFASLHPFSSFANKKFTKSWFIRKRDISNRWRISEGTRFAELFAQFQSKHAR